MKLTAETQRTQRNPEKERRHKIAISPSSLRSLRLCGEAFDSASLYRRLLSDDWQQYVRRVFRIQVNGIGRRFRFIIHPRQFARIRVRLKSRGIAGRYGNADPMAWTEDQACGPEVNLEIIYLARFHKFALFHRIAMTRPNDAIQHDHASAVRVHIAKFRREISVCGS